MKTKLLGERGRVATSLASAALYHLFKFIAFYGLYIICVMLIIPSLALYSRELADKLYIGYENINPAVLLTVVMLCFIASSFVCAGLNYRFRKKMRKHFFSETFGMINYRDGLCWYFKNYGMLELMLIPVISFAVSAVLAFRPVLILLGVISDALGAYVSLRRGLTLWRIHSITCD